MKTRALLISALLLTGCQTINTQQTSPQPDTEVKTNSDTQALLLPSPIILPDAPSNQTTTPVKKSTATKPIINRLNTTSNSDLWPILTRKISLNVPNDPRIRQYRRWYLKNPEHIRIVAQRAEPFLYYITQQVKKRGMPLEIALLPIVESSFDQFAHSSSNAGGLWQIIPATGRKFGLKQNTWYDGRYDVIESTQAALDLLQYLHNKFNNWPLALAAYNCGEGRVFRAMRKNKAKGLPTDFWALSLPRETSDYVPKLYAIADIINHPTQYGLRIPAIPNKPAISIVKPNVQMDLAVIARYAGLSLNEIKALNPAFNHGITAPGHTNILLPINAVSRFNQQFARHDKKGFETVTYIVKSGDSLGKIAQRYNSSTRDIEQINRLKNHTIRIGQRLTIPVLQSTKPMYFAQAPQKNTYTLKNSYYTVKSGDSLSQIAQRYKMSTSALMALNNIKNTQQTLRIGQNIKIAKTTKTTTQYIKNSQKTNYASIGRYVVKNGDSLWTIANQYDVSVNQLAKWNDLKTSHPLRVGQNITIKNAPIH